MKTDLPSLLGTYPRDSIPYYRDTCLGMVTAVLFITPRKDNENLVHTHIGVLLICNEKLIMKFAGTWMKLENILKEVMQI